MPGFGKGRKALRFSALRIFVIRVIPSSGGSARIEHERGFRHAVDDARKGAGCVMRHEPALFPTAHRRDRYADPARKLGLRQSGTPANSPHPGRRIVGCFGVIAGGLAFDLRFGGGIDPRPIGSRRYRLPASVSRGPAERRLVTAPVASRRASVRAIPVPLPGVCLGGDDDPWHRVSRRVQTILPKIRAHYRHGGAAGRNAAKIATIAAQDMAPWALDEAQLCASVIPCSSMAIPCSAPPISLFAAQGKSHKSLF